VSEREFLNAGDLRDLTGYTRASEQEEWLKTHAIPHRRDGRRIILARFHARAWLEGRHVVASNEPNLDALRRAQTH
jgi:hypothetical protein